MRTVFKNILFLLICTSVILNSCKENKEIKSSLNFKRFELFTTDGWTYSFRITVDSNGQYAHEIYNGKQVGFLPDSLFKSIDSIINNISTDSTIKTNQSLCCDCKEINLKIYRNNDTLDIKQFEINHDSKIDSKLYNLVSMFKELPFIEKNGTFIK